MIKGNVEEVINMQKSKRGNLVIILIQTLLSLPGSLMSLIKRSWQRTVLLTFALILTEGFRMETYL
jgi:hypothetical protein